jgi:hypothetical protein
VQGRPVGCPAVVLRGRPAVQGQVPFFFFPARPSPWRLRRLTGPGGVPSQRSNLATPATPPARPGHEKIINASPPFIHSCSRSTPPTRPRQAHYSTAVCAPGGCCGGRCTQLLPKCVRGWWGVASIAVGVPGGFSGGCGRTCVRGKNDSPY